MENNLHIATMAVHGGARKDDTFGAINEPIYMTSNYRIPTDGTPVDWSGIHSNIYQRKPNGSAGKALCSDRCRGRCCVCKRRCSPGCRVHHNTEFR